MLNMENGLYGTYVFLSRFRARMEQMKLRHLDDFSTRTPLIPPPQGTESLICYQPEETRL